MENSKAQTVPFRLKDQSEKGYSLKCVCTLCSDLIRCFLENTSLIWVFTVCSDIMSQYLEFLCTTVFSVSEIKQNEKKSNCYREADVLLQFNCFLIQFAYKNNKNK